MEQEEKNAIIGSITGIIYLVLIIIFSIALIKIIGDLSKTRLGQKIEYWLSEPNEIE